MPMLLDDTVPATIDLGRVAQLGERLICIQKAAGSSPVTSTKFMFYLDTLD